MPYAHRTLHKHHAIPRNVAVRSVVRPWDIDGEFGIADPPLHRSSADQRASTTRTPAHSQAADRRQRQPGGLNVKPTCGDARIDIFEDASPRRWTRPPPVEGDVEIGDRVSQFPDGIVAK